MSQVIGEIVQVIGPVVDVSFEKASGELPRIYDALEVKRSDGQSIILEVQQDIGENTLRTIAMDSTDGLQRGMDVVSHGGAIRMPKGDNVRGRLLNVIGDAIDGMEQVTKDGYGIHGEPPKFEQLTTQSEVLFTGIKVIDLLEPYAKGGKIGLFGGAGVGKTVIIMELINNIAGANDSFSGDPQKTTLNYHDGSVTLTVDANGRVTHAEGGFDVSATLRDMQAAKMTTTLTADQTSRLVAKDFVW